MVDRLLVDDPAVHSPGAVPAVVVVRLLARPTQANRETGDCPEAPFEHRFAQETYRRVQAILKRDTIHTPALFGEGIERADLRGQHRRGFLDQHMEVMFEHGAGVLGVQTRRSRDHHKFGLTRLDTFENGGSWLRAKMFGEVVALCNVDVADTHHLHVLQHWVGEHRAIVLGDATAAHERNAHGYLRPRYAKSAVAVPGSRLGRNSRAANSSSTWKTPTRAANGDAERRAAVRIAVP